MFSMCCASVIDLPGFCNVLLFFMQNSKQNNQSERVKYSEIFLSNVLIYCFFILLGCMKQHAPGLLLCSYKNDIVVVFDHSVCIDKIGH